MRKQFTIVVIANEFDPSDQAKNMQRIVRDVMGPVAETLSAGLDVRLELKGSSEPKPEGGE